MRASAVSVSAAAGRGADLRSLVVAPLLVESQVFGVLVVRAAASRQPSAAATASSCSS